MYANSIWREVIYGECFIFHVIRKQPHMRTNVTLRGVFVSIYRKFLSNIPKCQVFVKYFLVNYSVRLHSFVASHKSIYNEAETLQLTLQHLLARSQHHDADRL